MHGCFAFPFVAVLLLALASSACGRDRPPAPADAPAASASTVARVLRPPRMLRAESGSEPVSALVRRERAAAESEGGRLLVVVGAEWCEPCRRFHAAVAEGRLDAAFPGLVCLELDLDRDGARLREDGYGSRLIPLFALPELDGRGSMDLTQRFEGSIKGEGAVDEITPRLRQLIGRR